MTAKITNSEINFISFEDACKYLQVTASKLYQLTSQKQITFYKPQGKIYFKKSDLDKWIASGIVKPVKK